MSLVQSLMVGGVALGGFFAGSVAWTVLSALIAPALAPASVLVGLAVAGYFAMVVMD